MASKPIYFKGLNEIRALAAMAVLWHHLEYYKFYNNLPSLVSNPLTHDILKNLGINGVWLFFNLSGFLITFLLLSEQKETGTVSIGRFYLRRVLRIWPVYFTVLIIGFLALPWLSTNFSYFFSEQIFFNNRVLKLDYGQNLVLFLFFMSNIALSLFTPVAGSAQSWSVSVEEQFYLVWPWVIHLFRDILVPFLLAIVVTIPLIQKNITFFPFLGNSPIFVGFISSFHIDFMALGGLFAYLYFHFPDQLRKVIKHPIVLGIVILVLAWHFRFEGHRTVRAFIYSTTILSAIEWGLHIRILNFLGKISYGIYMYHPFAMYLVFALYARTGIGLNWINPFVYFGVVAGTILLSLLSYHYLELPLLRRKEHFATVKSGKIEL